MANRIKAKDLKVDQWVLHNNPRSNFRIVNVNETRTGHIKVHFDYGDPSSEPGTCFYEPDETLLVD